MAFADDFKTNNKAVQLPDIAYMLYQKYNKMPSYAQGSRRIREFARNIEKQRNKRVLDRAVGEAIRKEAAGRRASLSGITGEKIAQARKALGFTQKRLAKAAHTSQSVVARIEKGRHNLSIKKLELLVRALEKNLYIDIR